MAASSALKKASPYALSLVRVVVALLFIEHGTGKLFGFPPFFHPAAFTLLWFQGILETFGGFLILIGFITRPVAFLLCGDMAVAYFMVHFQKSFFPALSGGDPAVLFCFSYLYFFFAGPGPISVDALVWKSAGD